MATTINNAFEYFIASHVNLDGGETSLARASRDWLIKQINTFYGNVVDFPRLYPEMNIDFGSFARKTKIRELDDIDLIIALYADGTIYDETLSVNNSGIRLHVPSAATTQLKYCHEGTNILNSRKIVNKFVSALSSVPNYDKAAVHRKQEAATLNLKSYAWCFDIVPAFFTMPDYQNKTYYIIPDGQGHWKKTDPRIDKDRVISINQHHDGIVLRAIRAIKYWNKRPTIPSMPSYLLENMVLNYFFENYYNKQTNYYVDIEVKNILGYIYTTIWSAVNDPKGVQGDLNNLSYEDKMKVSTRAYLDYVKALEARKHEDDGNHETSIKKWGEIFGPLFPLYG